MADGKKETASQTVIRDFPMDSQPWRIEWIGRISYSTDDEPRIRIHISRIKQGISFDRVLYNDSLFGNKETGFHYKAVDIKIGFIQLLKIGSVWINGVEQLNYRGVEETFDISPDSVTMLKLAKTGSVKINNEWENILTNYQFRTADDLARQESWVAIVRDHSKYKKIVIPSSVIFQSYYVTSPKAATKIVFGQLDKLIDLEQSGYLTEDPTIFRLSIRANYKGEEGFLLANLATDPAAKENLRKLRQNIVIQKSRVTPEESPTLLVNFPFSNIMRMEVVGKPIPYNATEAKSTEIGFFVSDIRYLKTAFQFDTLIPVRKNDNRKGKTQEDELKDTYGGKKPAELGEDDQAMLTDNDVSDDIEATQIDSPLRIDISDVKVIIEDKEYQTHKNKPYTSIGKEGDRGASTGDSRQAEGGESKIDIVLDPVELDSFFNIIDILKSRGLQIKFLSIFKSVQVEKGIINYFPTRIKGCYSWHLTEDEKRTRTFIVAAWHYSGTWHYLIDVEAKNKNGLSIAYIRTHEGQEISTDDFEMFMKRVAKANGWSIDNKNAYYLKSWRFRAIDHSRKGDYNKVANNVLRGLLA